MRTTPRVIFILKHLSESDYTKFWPGKWLRQLLSIVISLILLNSVDQRWKLEKSVK